MYGAEVGLILQGLKGLSRGLRDRDVAVFSYRLPADANVDYSP
jgi:hypothetical protein